MTSKERIEKALKGEKVDRTPFCPFLTYWWEAQGEDIKGQRELAFLESIGADPLFRGHYPDGDGIFLAEVLREDCEIHVEQNEVSRTVCYRTSKGTLTERYRFVKEGQTWFLVEYPIKEEEGWHRKYCVCSGGLS